MTRRRDLMLEDLFGCDHTPETAVTDEGHNIVFWVCRCGRRHDPQNVARELIPEEPKKETP